MSDTAIKFRDVGKKFCKSLKHSMLYGAVDILQAAGGIMPDTSVLRKDEFWAVDHIDFELKKGESLGIVGPNGAGKTTILKLMNGIFLPDRGRIEIHGRVGSLIQVGAGFHPLLTGRENIYVKGAILGMSQNEIRRKIDSIVDFAGIGDFLDSPVKFYSSGMYVRLGFSIAIHSHPDILIVDEILAVGDAQFQAQCLDYMNKYILGRGASVVFVSHSRYSVFDLCQKCLYIHKGTVESHGVTQEVMKLYSKDSGQGSSSFV